MEQRTFEVDKVDDLPENMVKLDMATRVKLTQAEKKLDAVRTKYTKRNCYKSGFIWPSKGADHLAVRPAAPAQRHRRRDPLGRGHRGARRYAGERACLRQVVLRREGPSAERSHPDHRSRPRADLHVHPPRGFAVKVNDEVKQGAGRRDRRHDRPHERTAPRLAHEPLRDAHRSRSLLVPAGEVTATAGVPACRAT